MVGAMNALRQIRGLHLTDEGFKQCMDIAKCSRSDAGRIEKAALDVSTIGIGQGTSHFALLCI